jgi:phenylacetate-CoA ligase
MSATRLEHLYARAPVWAQHGMVTVYGVYWHRLRFGSGYAQCVREYQQRESFNAIEWRDWQRARVTALLQAAATHIPYYRKTWTSAVKAAAAAGRLDELPILDKEPIRTDPEAFVRPDLAPLRRLTFHTSGSTGTPIATIWTTRELRNSLALREVRSARWAGVSFTRRRATFSGRMVEPDPQSAGPFYRFNAAEGQVYLSPFHLRPDTAAAYVEALRKHRVEWLTGYAFSYYMLAKHIVDQRLQPPPLGAVVTTSEKVTPGMRRVMEAAYRCRVFEEYSTVENSVFASECPSGRLHVSPDAGVIEILRHDGTACDPGEVGEVVATCLMRDYQVFVRYRLGDLAQWDPDPCPCGRPMPVLTDVVGRIEDAVIGPDGRELVRFHGVFIEQPHVREAQVVQETLTRIRVKVVPDAGFGAADAADIMRRTQLRLGPRVDVIVEPVSEIPRTSAGKFRAVVSLVQQPSTDGPLHLDRHSVS